MLSDSPPKVTLSRENAESKTHFQHNHALDIQPSVQDFPALGSSNPNGMRALQNR